MTNFDDAPTWEPMSRSLREAKFDYHAGCAHKRTRGRKSKVQR